MKNCEASGIYGFTCRLSKFCLKHKEYGDGDHSVTSDDMQNSACPVNDIKYVKKKEEIIAVETAKAVEKSNRN